MTLNFAHTLKNTAKRLLAFYGNEITVTRLSIADYNPSSGGVGDGPSFDYIGWGNQDTFNFLEQQTLNIRENDIKFLFASDTRPEVGDIFNIEGVKYRAMNVSVVNAQDSDIVYSLQLTIG